MAKLTYFTVSLGDDDDQPRHFTNHSMALVYADLVALRLRDAGLPIPDIRVTVGTTETSD